MDLLESGDERPSRLRPLLRDPRAVAVGAVLVLLGGLVAVVPVERATTRVQVALSLSDATSTTVRGAARGELVLRLVNARDAPVELTGLGVTAEGLRVERVEPASATVPASGELQVRVGYVVPSCAGLRLPGAVSARLASGGDPVTVVAPLVAEGDGVRFGACPPGAVTGVPADVAVRAAGGTSQRERLGAFGQARVEVRNAGEPVRLLRLDAELGGLRTVPRVLAGGRTLTTDEVVVLRLRFVVPDCRLLASQGELVLRVARGGAEEELRLPLGRDGTGAATDLPVLLDACS